MSKHYLYRVSILSKQDSHPLSSIAYYSGENQVDVIKGKKYDSNTTDKVVWSNIIIPDRKNQMPLFRNLPEYLKFRTPKADLISNARNILWQNTDIREQRPDSQFARLFELSVPHFLTQEESVLLIQKFAKTLVNEGMIVDCALHSHNKKSPTLSLMEKLKLLNSTSPKNEDEHIEKNQDYTAYLMCTLRGYNEGRFENKNRDWNHITKMKSWRFEWVQLLAEAIYTCEHSKKEDVTDIANWESKLSIYSEYSTISQNTARKMSM